MKGIVKYLEPLMTPGKTSTRHEKGFNFRPYKNGVWVIDCGEVIVQGFLYNTGVLKHVRSIYGL